MPRALAPFVLALVLAFAPSARAAALRHPLSYSTPLFKLPMARVEDGERLAATLGALPGELERCGRAALASGDGAYDWVFAQVYARVTREIVALAREGKLRRPGLLRVEIAQFYEVYARNLIAWRSGGEAEPAWARAARVSRRLARQDDAAGRARHDRMTFAGLVLLQSMYAHITVDLPRVLLMLYHGQRPATPEAARALLADMRADFYALTPAFDRAVAEVLSDHWVSWEHADELPPPVRRAVERYGAGAAVRLMRTWAYERFEYNVRRGAHRDELLALPAASDVSHLTVTAP